jgi:hypothetical protein
MLGRAVFLPFANDPPLAPKDFDAGYDTCFAILFLKRATRPPVPSVDSPHPR